MTRKTIFITGAAAGIGRACAQRFHDEGWFVGLYDIDLEACQSLAEQWGHDTASAGRLDVTDVAGWDAALADFFTAAGERLDALFNNAGILRSGPYERVDLEQQHLIVDINVKGVMNGCHRAFEYLNRTPGSRVINMASASAIYGQPDLVTYAATKFAVRGLTEGLDIEWRKHGVRVMDVWPLFVQTGMIDNLDGAASVANMGVKLTPDDVAAVVWKAANQRGGDKPHWPVGFPAKALSQAVRVMPGWLNRKIVAHVARR